MRENGFAPVPVILIVDDQPTDTLLLQEAVADLGEIYTAHDGDAALELATAHRPDLILLDVQMPGMSGFQLCKTIKATRACAMPPLSSSPRTRRPTMS
ncbi:response regulator [Halopseudomonas pachastrellae]|nr:response regulator [Halopseudomonas pachastrellae]